MTGTKYLMGTGMPAQQAKRLGLDPTAVTGAGTTQATAQAIGQFTFYVRAVAGGAGSAYAFTVSSVAEVGSEYTVVNASTNTVVIWPPSGGQFNIAAGATATGLSLALSKGLFILTVTATTFDVFLSA